MKKKFLSILLALAMCLTLLPTSAFAEAAEAADACTCETICTDTAMNTACPICGAENAQVTDCSLYTAADPEPETLPPEPDTAVAAVQRLVSTLPAANALDGMSMDELNVLYEDVQAAWDAFDALNEEQQATLAAEESKLYELLAAINGYVQPADSGSSVNYIEFSWDQKTKTLTSETKAASGCTAVTSETTTWNTGWYVVSGEITINGRVTVTGDVKLILADGANLIVSGGIAVNKDNTFTVYAQSQPVFKTDGTLDEVNTKTGKLTAQNVGSSLSGIGGDRGDGGEISIHGGMITAGGGYYATGIGGGWRGEGGEISIYGGVITATGSNSGAGIGGGSWCAGGEISIYGGTVAATGGKDGAGIGGGYRGEGGEISIHGGTVTATGGEDSAGIGGGYDSAGGTISIHGGMITAKGDNSAGIGGGNGGAGGTISIHGGMITATGGKMGAGIGGGYKGAGGEISICGGTITATGGEFGAGIGGGYDFPGGEITIRGGTITCTGGSYGAGIGGGNGGAGGTISFHGGTITAMGGINASGIGGGYHGPGGTISIHGGQIKAAGGAPEGGANSVYACAFSFVPVLKDNALCKLFAGNSLTDLTQVSKPADATYTGSTAVHVDADHDFTRNINETTHTCEKCSTVAAHAYIPNPDDETTHLCKGCGVKAKHAVPVLMADAARHTISRVCGDCLKEFGAFTLTAPTGPLTYDGNAKEAAVTGAIAGVATPEITYARMGENEEETVLSSAPVSAGTYRASITCGSGADAVSVSVTYTIDKAAPTIQLSIEDWDAGSTPSTPSVTGNDEHGREYFQYKVKNEDDSTYTENVPTEVGAYTIRVTVSETENYTQASTTADFNILAVATSSVTIDGTITQYASFADALTYANAAEGTPTLTLLADCTQESAQTVSRNMILDLNGKELSGTTALTIALGAELNLKGTTNSKLTAPITANGKLTVNDAVTLSEVTVENYGNIVVNANATFGKLSFNGGTATLNAGSFTAISAETGNKLNDSITLGDDKALRGSDKWYTGDSLKVETLQNVSVQVIPIKSLSVTSETVSTIYGGAVNVFATIEKADGVTEEPTYKWTLNGKELTLDFRTYNNSSFKAIGEQTFVCEVTIDGYTVSDSYTLTVYRAALPNDTTVTLTHDGETLRIGDTLTAKVSGLPAGETLSTTETTYTYYVDGVKVEGVTGDTLTVPSGSFGKTITVDVHIVTEHYTHSLDEKITSAPTAAVQKKACTTEATEPTDFAITDNSITVTTAAGYEYAISSTNTEPTSGWVTPANGEVTFEKLDANTTYYIFYRVAETEDAEAGEAQFVSKTTDKAAAAITINDPGEIVYDGDYVTCGTSDADLTYSYTGDGRVTVKWYNDNNGSKGSKRDGAPKNQGTYWVGISAAEGTDYAAAAEVTKQFTIARRPLTNNISIDSTLIYNGIERRVAFSIYESNGDSVPRSEYMVVDSSDCATNAGTYTLTIEGRGNYTGTVTKTWTLQKRTPAAGDFTVNGLTATYDGIAKAVTATLNFPMTGTGDLTVYYEGSGNTAYAKSTTAPTNAGTYTVTLDVAEGPNFKAASGLSLGTLTISTATQTITPADNGRKTIIKNGLDVDISTWTSSNAGDLVELTYTLVGTPAGITLSGTTLKAADAETTAGSFTIKVSADAVDVNNDGTPEYSAAAEQTISVTVVDRQNAGVTIDTVGDKTYGDSFTVTASVGTGVTGGTWSWTTSDDSILAITGGADSATVTVKAKKTDTTGAKLTVTYTSDTHYGTATTAAIPVAKKAISITGVSATERDYDGTTTVALAGGELVGKVTGDDLSFTLGSGTAESANAGTQNVTTAITLTGEDAENYTLTQPDGITVTIRKVNPDYTVPTGLTATYGQTLADVSLASYTGWSWMDDTQSVGDASDTAKNFKAAFTPTDTTNYNVMSNIDVLVTVGKANPTVPTGLAGLKGNALSTVTLPDGWTWDNSATIMDETKEYPASYAGSANYNAKSGVGVAVTVSDKQPQVLTVTMDGWTYGEAANDPQYTMPEGAASLTIQYKIKGTADSTYTATVPTNAGEYTVRISYETATEIWIGGADFTIAKATPTGEPKYTAITTSGKTLADAALTTEGSTFSVAGSVKWIDADGSELAEDTKVEANKEYRWLFTPTDTDNYNTISGSIKLWSRSSGGGGGGSYTPSSYTITVEKSAHGTISVSTKSAKSGNTVTITVTPDKGYDLENLIVLDGSGKEVSLTAMGDGKYTFKMPASAVTVKAVFAAERMENPFVDVPSGAYYEDAVLWALKNGITGGIDTNHFGPDLSCTRAQLVTFLWRAAGCPVVNYTMDFTDVGDSYYTEAVRWAASLGIVGGYGNGLFGSEDTITREQMATILYRFAQAVNMDTTQGGMAVREFADYDLVSGYAAEAMQWAVSAGILQGYNNHLMPSQPCTRAQIVTMLNRLLGE